MKKLVLKLACAATAIITAVSFAACASDSNTGAHTHSWSEWAAASADEHTRTCDCGEVETEAHNFGDDDVCDDCGYTRSETHTHSWTYSQVDENVHRLTCSCGESLTEAHNFGNDDVCDDCGYTREESHTHSWTYSQVDENVHRLTCGCGESLTEAHNFGNDDVCDDCGYTREESHTHSWTYSQVDENVHRLTCSCGESLTEAHNFGNDDVCDDCGYTREETTVSVTGVNLNTTSLTIYTDDESVSLTASVSPANATNKNITWKSDDTSVATVDQNGNVTPVGCGETTITVTTADGGYTAQCRVTVNTPAASDVRVTGVALDNITLALTKGDTQKLNANVAPSDATNKNVSWSSSDISVATVDQNGNINAVGGGEATITVTTADGGYTAQCAVTVTAYVSNITITGGNTVEEGSTLQLGASVSPSDATNKTVTWSTTSSIITVDAQTGLVTALSAGTATVTAASADGNATNSITITVTPKPVPVTGITLDNDTLELAKGDTQKLTANVLPENATNKGVKWVSSAPSVVTVDQSGNIDAVGGGEATITVTTDDGSYTAECTVTVTAYVTDITITGGNRLTAGSTLQLTASVDEDAADKTVTWSSSAPDIATVDAATGLVTGVKAGGATITATAKGVNGDITQSIDITVFSSAEEMESSIKITLASGDLETAYIEWEPLDGAYWYNVYYQNEGGTTWTQLDAPLVREYPDYFRADAVGLSAGKYTLKVVATDADGVESASSASETETLSVLAHERYGYAFVNGTSSGAYNENGTLKSNALVIYVTNNTKDTVTATIGDRYTATGIQNILNNAKRLTTPLAVRLIGDITDFDVMESGDMLIDNGHITVGITIEGIGNDATANGWGLRIKNSSNVEIRNIGFMNCDSDEGDNIGLQQNNDHIWVHNCDLFYGHAGSDGDQAKGDGALDTKKSTYVTHSYNHFWDSGKCNLQGNSGESTENYITYHHNWYDHSDSRHPRIRMATVHVFNNYFDGNAKYGVGVTQGSSTFVENNYFRSTAQMKPILSAQQGTDARQEDGSTFSGDPGGVVKAYGNIFDCSAENLKLITTSAGDSNKNDFDCYLASSRDEEVPSDYQTSDGTTYSNFDTADNFYTYNVDSAQDAKAKVEQFAGRVQGGDFQWEFNDAVDDADYSVNQELKAALTGYTGTLVKVGGEDSSVVIPGGGEEGGETGGETGGSDTPSTQPIPEGSTVVSFVSGDEYYYGNSGISVSGNTSTGKGSMTIDGKTYGTCLKMESSTSVTFTTTGAMTLTLYVDPDGGIKVDGTSYDSNGGVVTVELTAGNHEITKDNSINLFLIVLTSATA